MAEKALLKHDLAGHDARVASLEAQPRAPTEGAAAQAELGRTKAASSAGDLSRTEVQLLHRRVTTAEEAAADIGCQND